ncbi:MAG: hypothetical protein KC657_15355, partial [Myxococcales bacterium]|nr:hypothetical protein [Myxococcales bacterium]
WPSLHATPDPILQAKALPGVAERREKLTRVVKAGLAGCALLCAAAIVAGFIGGTSTAAAAGPARVARAAVVEKEGLEQVTVTKAHAATTAHAAKAPKKAHKPAKKAKARRGRR